MKEDDGLNINRIDFPCLKYIISGLNTEDDLLDFGVFFSRIFGHEGLTLEQISFEYEARIPQINNAGLDCYSLSGEKLSPSEFLVRTNTIRGLTKETCSEYCKRRIGRDYGNNICKCCRYFGKANEFENEEYALIRYACTDRNCFSALRRYIGSAKCVFRAMVDIAADIDYPHPITMSVTHTLFSQLQKEKDFFSDEGMEKRLRSDQLFNHFTCKMKDSDPEVMRVMSDYPKLGAVIYNTLIDKVMSAEDYNDSQINVTIDKIVKSRGKGRNPQKKDLLDGQMDFLSEAAQIIAEKQAESTEKKTVMRTEDTNSEEPKTEEPKAEEVAQPSPENVIELSDVEEEESAEEPITEEQTMDECTDEQATEGRTIDEPVGEPLPTHGDPLNDLSEMPLYVPIVWKDFLDKIPSYSDNESYAYGYVSKDKLLIYEIFICEGEYYMVFYAGHQYYKQSCENIPKSFMSLLLSKTVLKISWQSFLSYSIVKKKGYCINNIFGIVENYFRAYPNIKYGGYKDTLSRMYDLSIFRGQDMITGSLIASEMLSYMPSYYGIYERLFISDPGSYVECLGLSYLRNINLVSEETLFSIDINGRYVFNDNYETSVLREGNFLSYVINCPGMDSEEKKRTLEYVLSSLRHYFRKFNVQLIRFSSDGITLFCDDYTYDAVKTIIRMRLDEYASVNGISNFNHFSDHMHCTPENVTANIRELPTPYSLRSMQDMFTTTYDKVSVSPDKVRVSKPVGGSTRQKEVFPKG